MTASRLQSTACVNGSHLTTLPWPIAYNARVEILRFFLQTGWVAKVVLAILILFSLASWSVILAKWRELANANASSDRFLKVFRKAARLNEAAEAAPRHRASPLAAIWPTTNIATELATSVLTIAGLSLTQSNISRWRRSSRQATPSWRRRSGPCVVTPAPTPRCG